jgi:hypothetical protein
MNTDTVPTSLRRLRRVSGVFLFLALSGIVPLLAPYGIYSQWILLLHMVAGLLALIPLTLLFWRHGRAEHAVKRTSWLSPGLWSGIGWLAIGASGAWLIGKGIWGVYVPYRMHYFHLIVGIAFGAVALFHLAFGLAKSKFAKARYTEFARPLLLWAIVLGVGVTVIFLARRGSNLALANFSPSNARTATGRIIPADLLSGSASCGASGCHSTIYEEWRPSAHRYSALDLFYEAVKANYIHDRGADSPRYCAGCHEPIPLLAGEPFSGQTQDGGAEGSSCAFCHSLRDTETRGNANYVVHAPDPYLFEQSSHAALRRIGNLLIRLHPQQHDRDYDVRPSETAEFCGTCHKQYINKQENGWGFVQLQDQYDDWKNGPWHTDPRKNLQCQSCHMHEVSASDPARSPEGFIHEHRILASNNYMSEMLGLHGAQKQDALVNQWLAGGTYIPEISGVWPRGPILPLNLEPQGPFRAGKLASVRVFVTNLKVGHAFPTGPLDVIEAWLEFQVTDESGKQIFSAGTLGPHGELDGKTAEYRSYLMDKNDRAVFTHSLWNVVASQGKRIIPPGGSDTTVFPFRIPAKVSGPLRCEVRLLYRKFNFQSQAALFPTNAPKIPVIEISKASLVVPLEDRKGLAPKRADSGADPK